jgi:FkbM family methyltransferase
MEELGIPYRVSFAQNREDVILDFFFRDLKKGFYVDVGANDPNIDSVTKLFYQKGWNGINIEPIVGLYNALNEQRPRDLNLNIGVASKSGTIKFREYNAYHGLSTMAEDMQQLYDNADSTNENYKDFTEHIVPVKTLKEVFKENKVDHIHFLKVDVEGFEYEVLLGNDWQKYRPEVVCIEANHLVKDWRTILTKNGYSLVFNDGLNDYYVANDASEAARSFSYVDAILPIQYKPIFSDDIVKRVNELTDRFELEKKRLELQSSELWNKLNDVQHDLDVAYNQIEASKRLRAILRALSVKVNAIVEEQIYPAAERDKLHSDVTIPDVQIIPTATQQFQAIDTNDRRYLTQIKVKPSKTRMAALKGYRAAKKPAKRAVTVGIKSARRIARKGSK